MSISKVEEQLAGYNVEDMLSSVGIQGRRTLDLIAIKSRLVKGIENNSCDALEDLLNDMKKQNATKTQSKKQKNSDKENHVDNDILENVGRVRRKAFADATEKFSTQINVSDNSDQQIRIKSERISNEMPPPRVPPKRGRKKKTEKIKVEESKTSINEEYSQDLNEDIVFIEKPMSVISLDSNDERMMDANEFDQIKPELMAAKKSTAATKKVKRTSSSSSETKRRVGRTKHSKIKKSSAGNSSGASQYEDAVNVSPASRDIAASEKVNTLMTDENKLLGDQEIHDKPQVNEINLENAASSTSVINKTTTIKQTNPNTTVVIDKPRILNATVTLSKPVTTIVEDIMTDDDSNTEENTPLSAKTKVANQLFNPFENSPVKKRVEAFEKLGAKTVAQEIPVRITRSKIRQKPKAANEASKEKDEKSGVKTNITPTVNRLPVPVQSSQRGQISSSAKKALNAMKLCGQRDAEHARKDKEGEEALRKKEAMLQQQSAEKRRRHAEREYKVKVQREALEREKQRLNEMRRAKEEKQLKLQQEKQARLTNKREEAEKRRMLAKLKHDEIKVEEERRQVEEMRVQRAQQEAVAAEGRRQQLEQEERLRVRQREQMEARAALPMYMTQEAPLMPTPDCYDSDDENAPKQKPVLPVWNQREAMHLSLRVMNDLSHKVRNTFFCRKSQTPDLQKLFPNVDPRKLRRNSSAIWKRVPRFTMMPQIEEDF